ncbi:hypothetical protein ACQ86N_21560 [Puia sp. P3]|uniref:hypothetical protein n=1 Tax=Puia sp. P3 TaxID=3423952 RepID=UPI003D67C7A1
MRLLNDRYGIQTRGGCSCAGPYGHVLLGVDRERSHAIRRSVLAGGLSQKPGWVRLSLHPTMTNAEIVDILIAIRDTAASFREWEADYCYDAGSNEFRFRGNRDAEEQQVREWFERFRCPPYGVPADSPRPLH